MHIIETAALAVFLFLAAAGCGEDQSAGQQADARIDQQIQASQPVLGWLSVTLPGEPVAIDAGGEDIWILTDTGLVMNWNTGTKCWTAVETSGEHFLPEEAFDVRAFDHGVAILSPKALAVLYDSELTEAAFEDSEIPVDMCSTGEGMAVLFQDGSAAIFNGTEMEQAVEPCGIPATGSLVQENGVLAWMNSDSTASTFDIAESLLTEIALPEGTEALVLSGGVLLAGDGASIWEFRGQDGWEYRAGGILAGNGFVYDAEGIRSAQESTLLTTGLPEVPENICMTNDGTLWSFSMNSLAFWGEIGSVDTRLPDADVQRLSCRLAGQTSGGVGGGQGVGASGVSLGGAFRIYESVSSRPDPFTEFPAASRDLRRPLEDLTIEELHLVGITVDPSGGDQAMVEDANGVAYILREGTELRNNTRIAEITGNEVIVIQEVTVGSEDAIGGTTSIPTIFSMRLHEEGGL